MTLGKVGQLIDAVDLAISDAERGVTELPREVLEAPGTGSDKISIFFHSLCRRIQPTSYLEFGTFLGRSLVAAAWGNEGMYVGVDPHLWLGPRPEEHRPSRHGQYCPKQFGTPKELVEVLNRTVAMANRENPMHARVFSMPWQTFCLADGMRWDVCFYDGDHTYEQTRDGVAAMVKMLRPGVLIVDDYSWDRVRRGVVDGIESVVSLDLIHHSRELPRRSGWHQGLGVWVLG